MIITNAECYFTHETEEDKLWYSIFFATCRELGISWAKAAPEQRVLIEEATRKIYEEEAVKRNL